MSHILRIKTVSPWIRPERWEMVGSCGIGGPAEAQAWE